ncbi:MAG: LysR family transcriptional regulator [Gemmatimonadaceae bacterium]|nr:LysR family transcriptional regulator [Gemmatimonadaceae bacterium]NUP54233.1 LysR family transcriptional regulator [Gemmatimonadaceae bacterium]
MNLRQLQYFVAVVDDGGFRQAAARLHVAQPALSRQVQAMESALGLTLLDRGSRRVGLTAAGTAYLRAARAVLADVANSVRRARLASVGRVGRCTIALPRPALATGPISQAAERIAAHHPEIELTITEADIPDHWEMLRRGDVDVTLGMRPPPAIDGIECEPLWQEAIRCALLPATHPLAHRASVRLADLRGEPFLTVEPTLIPDVWAQIAPPLARVGIERAQMRIARSMSGVRTLVAAGHGWALVSEAYQHQPPTGTAVVVVDDFSTTVDRYLQWRSDDHRALLTVVLDMLRVAAADIAIPDGTNVVLDTGASHAFLDPEVVELPRALELRHLEYLHAAVTAASIGEAAEALGITQPVLSRQLRDLEGAIGVDLLERGRRGVRATAAGDLLIRETRHIATRLTEAAEAATRAQRGALGECVLATISTPMGIHVVASVLADCARTAPELSIEISEVPSIAQQPALLSATVDVGFSALTVGSEPDPSIVHEHMLDDPLDCVLVAASHPLALRDRIQLSELDLLPFLFSSRASHPAFYEQVMQRLRRLDLRSPVDATYGSLHLRWSRVAERKGWCLGFRSQRMQPPRGTVAIGVDGLMIPWGMELLWRAGDDRPMVATLVEAFRRAAAVARAAPAYV